MKYVKALIRKRKGGMIDEKAIIRRKKLIDKEYDECTLLELETHHKNIVEEWETFKKEAVKRREDALLELYPNEIVGDSEEIVKKGGKQLELCKRHSLDSKHLTCYQKELEKETRRH